MLNKRVVKFFTDAIYLRMQYTYVNSMNSVHMKIISGFPQGYIPGTLLFIIFINDVPTASNLFKYYYLPMPLM